MKHLLILLMAVTLAACGGGSGGNSTDSSGDGFTPPTTSISSMKLLDASGQPLVNAAVQVSQAPAGVQIAAADPLIFYTDENGDLQLNNLAPGTYTLTITIGGVTVTSVIVISEDNASEGTTVAAPLIVDGEEVTSLQGENGDNLAIFASFSGVIYTANGPLAGAQIEISGGADTNGAVASDITNEDGEYLLIINVSLEKLAAMQQATLRIYKEGYFSYSETFDITSALAFIGQNFAVSELPSGSAATAYSENFEQISNGATCGSWTAEALTDGDYSEEPMIAAAEVTEEETMTNLWHSHDSGLGIVNQAIAAGLSDLAPDDTSGGAVPDPFDQHACWYGQAADGNVGQGNFLGDIDETEGGDENDGGTSDIENGGAIVSPVIDLGSEDGPLALTFRTFWEIESVNPNENGYDLLIIAYSTDSGETWTDLARLNPLSDPASGELDRAPIPYSNRGFNRAPAWLWQEPIDLSALAGESSVQLRFEFRTNDELYNGFRGWLLDDVRIIHEEGTFPLYDGEEDGEELPEECLENPEECFPLPELPVEV